MHAGSRFRYVPLRKFRIFESSQLLDALSESLGDLDPFLHKQGYD